MLPSGWQQAKIKGVGLQEKGPKIRRKWLPNVQRTTFHSNVLGLDFEMPATVNAVKTVHKWGSFDNYLVRVIVRTARGKGGGGRGREGGDDATGADGRTRALPSSCLSFTLLPSAAFTHRHP